MNVNFHFDEETSIKVYDLYDQDDKDKGLFQDTRCIKIKDESGNEIALFMSLLQLDRLGNYIKNHVELFAIKE